VSPARWRVTVVDDHALFAESLVIALGAHDLDASSVVPEGPTTSLQQLRKAVAATCPDIVLLDLDLGVAGAAMRLLSSLSATKVKVFVVTGSTDRVQCGEALAKGARALIPKSAPLHQIVEAVTRTRDGLPAMQRAERDALLRGYRDAVGHRRELHAKFSLLTLREGEVLGQLMTGRQVSEIARLRFVSESTVRTQVKSILVKLGVSSQLTAVGMAHQAGWQPPGETDPGDPGLRAIG